MEKIEIISRNKDYSDGVVLIENRVEKLMEDIETEYTSKITVRASYINNHSPEYNHSILFVADTKEELYNIVFGKQDSLQYCYGTTVYVNKEIQKECNDFFFNHKDGISNYYKAGGDMW